MTRGGFMRLMICAGLLAAGLGGAASAGGAIEKACSASGRAASGAVCGCLQSVADQVLSGADQRKAARFFSDPDQAQAVRVSDSAAAEAFWNRYAAFASAAEASCSPG